MKYGFNDMGFPHESLAENFKTVAEAGYDGVEPTLTDETLTDPAEIERMAKVADEHDLRIPSVLTSQLWETPLSDPNQATRQKGIDVATRTIEAGARLGAETMLIVPGVVTEDAPYDVVYENALTSVRELAPVAEEHGITLAIENVWNDFLLSPMEFASFIDEARTAGPVGAYFDVGNVVRFGDPKQWIRILGDRIENVHLKDYDAGIDTAEGFTYPTLGDVSWDGVVEALDDIDYDGWITPEVPPYETSTGHMPRHVFENTRAVFE
jgi:hexulose-6-phosphate isomerase